MAKRNVAVHSPSKERWVNVEQFGRLVLITIRAPTEGFPMSCPLRIPAARKLAKCLNDICDGMEAKPKKTFTEPAPDDGTRTCKKCGQEIA